MAKTTKTEILEAALFIFARDGYDGTNIKDIAEVVGLVNYVTVILKKNQR